MAEFQTVGAVLGLAFDVSRLAHKAVKLIRRVIQAEIEAEALQHRIEHLGNISKSVGKVLKYRKKKRGDSAPPAAELDIIKTIRQSLVECRSCLDFICGRLKPYYAQEKRGTLDKLSTGFKFINSQPFIESQEKIINTHLQNLTLSVTLLNNLGHVDSNHAQQEQSRYLREVRILVEAIARQVVDEQSSAFRLLESSTDDTVRDEHHTSESDDSDLSDSDDSDLDIKLKHCSECWKRNLPVPDTPLAIAVKRKEADRVRGMLETCTKEEDIRIPDAKDWTLLHYAAHKGDHATLRVLLESSLVRSSKLVNARSKDGQTALMQIAKQADTDDRLELAKELIAHDCDLNAEDESTIGRSALYFAIDGPKTPNREHFVELLVGKGARKDDMSKKFPEKASFYSALREDPPNRERKGSTSSVGRKLSKVFSKSEE